MQKTNAIHSYNNVYLNAAVDGIHYYEYLQIYCIKRNDLQNMVYVPWYAKLVSILVVGYALSPIDFIPDFIPVLGYLDDIILLPLGISLAIKLILFLVMEECRIQAKEKFRNIKPQIDLLDL